MFGQCFLYLLHTCLEVRVLRVWGAHHPPGRACGSAWPQSHAQWPGAAGRARPPSVPCRG
eukprot:65813-Chlamydomonas_euryale.AAC.1